MKTNMQLPSHHVTADTRLPSVPQSSPTILLLYPLFGLWFAHLYFILVKPNWSLEFVTFLGVISSIYGIAVAAFRGPTKINFVVVYGSYLALSHLGLVVSDLLVPGAMEAFQENIGLERYHFQGWYFNNTYLSFTLAAVGLAINSFFIGAGLLGLFGKRYKYVSQTPESILESGNQSIFRFGIGLLALCSLYIAVMMLFGFLPLFGSYLDYVKSLSTAPLYHLFLVLLSVGTTFTLATGSYAQIRRHLIWILIPSFLLLITGNRGEIFYAAASSAAILSLRGFVFRFRSILMGVFILFVLIPSIRQIRHIALPERDIGGISLNLTDGIMELGYQVRPLALTIQWIRNGEPLAYGGTYLLPIQRIIALALPFIEREPIEGNRLNIAGRVAGMGYSVIAEAYFNFGEVGLVIIMACIGYFLTLANRASSTRSLALYGAITAVLINSLRNTFIFVPGQVIIVLILFQLALLFKPKTPQHQIAHES